MPFNGSGTFVPLAAPDFPAVAGDLIEATKFNNNLQDIFVQGLSKCITKDGQSVITGNLPMSGFKHTGVANAVGANEYAAFGQVPGLRGALGIVDWDTILLTGIYEGEASSLTSPSTNFPPTTQLGQLLVMNQGSVISHIYAYQDGAASRTKIGSTWSNWSPVEFIATNLTLNVPADYATIQAALDYLKGKIILGTNVVTIQLADGTHTITASMNLNHPNGEKIKITGNTTTPANVVLASTGFHSFDFFTLTDGHTFNTMQGFTIQTAARSTGTFAAVKIVGSNLLLAFRVNTLRCQQGFTLDEKAFAYLDQCEVSQASKAGFSAEDGSYLKTKSCYINDVNGSAGGSGNGVYLYNHCVADHQTLTTISCRRYGMYIEKQCLVSSLVGDYTTGVTGAEGILVANESTLFSDSDTVDFFQLNGIRVIGHSSLISSNGSYYSDNTLSGILIEEGSNFFGATTGNINSVNNGRYGIEVKDASYIGVKSATLTGNALGATSEYMQFNQAPGSAPELLASGPSTAVDLKLTPGAAGNVMFGVHSAIAAETITGYITIKDASGVLRKLAVVS